LNGGIENGFAILKDLRGPAKFLLIPTVQIDGIESPILLSPNAPNYFAHAWNARKYLDVALGKPLPRSGIGLAINSAKSRNQDQLHIHIACVYSEVFEALKKNQGLIGNEWAPFKPFLLGQHYFARWIAGENLGENNPFVLLAKTLPGAAQDMDNWTLAVIGFTRIDGTEGFVILADQFNGETRDWASGEELLDNSCGIAAVQK
jgi:CDP-diacylglycerol pyrophosphatase